MKLPRRFSLVLLLSTSLPAMTGVARAAPAAQADKESAARAHYQKGATLFRQQDYAGAWLEFTSAYQLLPRAELLFNMARCEVKLGRPADALAHFKAYLEAFPNDPDANGIRKEMEGLRIEVSDIEKREAARQQAQGPAQRTAEPGPKRPFPVYGTIAGAGTVLFGIIGVALLGSVSSRYGQLQQTCAPNCRPEEVRPLEQQANAGYVFLGLTAAAAVTTAALLTWELRRAPDKKLTLGPTLSGAPGLGLSWRY